MTMRPTLALIATRPGSLQDSLVALMTTMDQVNAVLIAEDGASALRMMAQHRPALVVIETGLPTEEGHVPLQEIKTRWPQTRCIALVEDIEQQQQAESAGADVVLIAGFPPARFIAAIEGMLSHGKEGSA
jgi:DNA-binding NarL/FixJ family response regulator